MSRPNHFPSGLTAGRCHPGALRCPRLAWGLLCLLLISGPLDARLLSQPIIPYHGFLAHIMARVSRSFSLGINVGVLTNRRFSENLPKNGMILSSMVEGMPIGSFYSPLIGIRLEQRF